MNGLALLSLIATLCCFGFGAYQDMRKFSVSNWVWVVCGLVGGGLSFVNFWVGGQLVAYLSMAGIAGILSFVLWSKLGFGGADAKALMCLGLVVPFLVPFVVLFALPFSMVYAVVRAKKTGERFSLKSKIGVPYITCLFAGLLVTEILLTIL